LVQGSTATITASNSSDALKNIANGLASILAQIPSACIGVSNNPVYYPAPTTVGQAFRPSRFFERPGLQ